MHDVFLSYAREDAALAEQCADAFTTRGWSTWWDRRIVPGQFFDRHIETAIEQSRCLVVLWSGYSVVSDWVRAEAAEGLRRGVLVPVSVDGTRPPLPFRNVQTVPLEDWDGDPTRSRFAQLFTDVQSVLDEAHPKCLSTPSIAPPDLELVSVRVTHDYELDITVRNVSARTAVIHKIVVSILRDNGVCLPKINPTAQYDLPINDVQAGESASLEVTHAVPPYGADRILVALHTTRVLSLRVSLLYNKDQQVDAGIRI